VKTKLRSIRYVLRKLPALYEIPVKQRGKAAELLVEYQLLKYATDIKRMPRGIPFVGDRVVFVKSEGKTMEVPVEIKSITIKNPRSSIDIAQKFLSIFKGIYIVLIQSKEHHDRFDFLVFMNDEMHREISKAGFLKKHDKRSTRKRWRLIIPRNLKDFKNYVDRWDKILDFNGH